MGGLFGTGFGRTWTSTGTFPGNVARWPCLQGLDSCDRSYFAWIRLHSCVGRYVTHKRNRAGLELNFSRRVEDRVHCTCQVGE